MPLDPPLRSRFQGRNIESISIESMIEQLIRQYRNVPIELITRLSSFIEAIRIYSNQDTSQLNSNSIHSNAVPYIAVEIVLPYLCKLISILLEGITPAFPKTTSISSSLIARVFCYDILAGDNLQFIQTMETMMKKFGISDNNSMELKLAAITKTNFGMS